MVYLLALLGVGIGNWGFCLLNEVLDVETDRIIKPWKPIPSGQVEEEKVGWAAAVVLVFSLILIISVYVLTKNDVALAFGLASFLLGLIYNFAGKSIGIAGNIALGGSYGAVIAYFLMLGGALEWYWAFPLAFGLFTFAFNLVVMWQDIPGDIRAGLYTAAMELGKFTGGAAIMTAILSLILYLKAGLPIIPTIIFVFDDITVVIGGIATYINSPRLVEISCRRVGRILLLAGATALLIF